MIEQHNSLAEQFLKKGVWLYLFSFIIAPMGYIIKIIISNDLSVSDVGILYGIISLITLLSAYNDLGMTDSLNYFVPKFITENRYDKVKTILMYTLLAQIITGISITLFLFFGAEFISNNYFKSFEATNILKIFSMYFLGINIFQICSTFFMVIQNTFLNKIIDLIRMSFTLIGILIVFIFDFGNLENFSYNWIIGLYIGIIFAIIIFYKKYYKIYLINEKILWDKKLFLLIFKYAITIFIGSQAGVILSQIDMQMIIYMLGTTDAGYYTNYLSIISIPFIVIGPIFGLFYPIFSEMHSKGEIEKIKQIKSIFQKSFLIIGIAFNILFFVFAEKIAFILFGEKFITSGIILKYSILFLIFNFLLQINGNILAGIGKVNERLKIVLIAVIFSFFTNLILINYMGVNGASLATGIGWFIIWILGEIYLGKEYFVQFDYKILGKNVIFIGILGFILYLFSDYLFYGYGRGASFFILAIISVIYFGIFILFNYNEFKFFILEIKKIIINKKIKGKNV